MTKLPTRSFLMAAVICAVMIGTGSIPSPGVWAAICQPGIQEPDAQQRSASELGERQRLVARKMAELEERFARIARELAEKEPEQAERLVLAFQAARERLVTSGMNDVARLMDEKKLNEAGTKLNDVLVSLDELYRLLVNREEQKLTPAEEEKMLQKWKEAIEQLRNEETKQERETSKLANKDETLEKLQKQIEKVNELIDRQKALQKQTGSGESSGLQKLDRIADAQYAIRQETKDLASEIADNPNPRDPTKPADGKGDVDGKPGDGKPQEENNKPESKSDAGQPGDKPGDKQGDKQGDKSASGADHPGQPADGKPKTEGGDKPGTGKPGGDSSAGEDAKPGSKPQPQPGQEPLEKAADHQRRAEEKLATGKADDAARQQEGSVDELEKAKQELEKEKRRIASLPPEAFEQMAKEQRRTRDKTMDVVRDMIEKPKAEKPDQDNAGPNQPQGQQPGQESLEQAANDMQNAEGDLEKKSAENAARKQKEASKKLDKALQEIEDRLAQLRDETREEKLARLEARFREMLDRQSSASLTTIEVDDRSRAFGDRSRRDRLLALKLSAEELEIAELGQQAYDLLLEDGTSVIFPEMVNDLAEQLGRAAKLLAEPRTDQLTQLVQREIESSLHELLDALEDSKQQGEGGGGGGGGGGEQPLLKKSAELKMLRFRQNRINRQTLQLDRMQNESAGDSGIGTELENTARQQEALAELAKKIGSDGQ